MAHPFPCHRCCARQAEAPWAGGGGRACCSTAPGARLGAEVGQEPVDEDVLGAQVALQGDHALVRRQELHGEVARHGARRQRGGDPGVDLGARRRQARQLLPAPDRAGSGPRPAAHEGASAGRRTGAARMVAPLRWRAGWVGRQCTRRTWVAPGFRRLVNSFNRRKDVSRTDHALGSQQRRAWVRARA